MADVGKKLKEGSYYLFEQLSTEATDITEMFELGKPSAFDESVDPGHRIGQYLKAKMNVIDIIPCNYTLDLTKAQKTEDGVTGMLPKIDYTTIEDYKKQCKHYGLDGKDGIRIYTTDDTNASDSLSNQLQDNYLQQGVNKLTNFGRQLQHLSQSVGLDKAREKLEEKAGNLGTAQGTGKEGENEVQSLLQTTIDIAAGGHRISLPKAWSETSYNPNFQANIKLVSPYGSPKAVKEFIIKPLTYLLLITSPITNDGVSYGRPYFVHIDAYGLSHTPIGVVSNITLRRGGNDTSFSIYRQPLTIDVSLDFEFLVSGFAAFSGQGMGKEQNAFKDADKTVDDRKQDKPVSLPTAGAIIRSLRPVNPQKEFHAHTDLSRAHGWGSVITPGDYSVDNRITPISVAATPQPGIEAYGESNENAIKQSVDDLASATQGSTSNMSENINDIASVMWD